MSGKKTTSHKRMLNVPDIAVPATEDFPGGLLGDVRVRVDLEALGREFAAKAITKRGHLVQLYGGAITIEAFNVRTPATGLVAQGLPPGSVNPQEPPSEP